MLYRDYGRTGEKVSALGFGAMRFPNVADEAAMAGLVLHAFEKGVNYFDTAPGYCKDKSEIIVGQAVKEMKRRGGKFYVSTKSGEDDGGKVREQLEQSLKRLNVEAIDFYHCWCVVSMEDWARRKSAGAVGAILKARDEGLIRHPCVSTHLSGEDIARVLGEGAFEGVTLGYSAINFPYRRAGIEAARAAGRGVVIMNPLGGGVIPKHEERFGFIRRPGDPTLATSALRFVLSTPGVTVALVGCDSLAHIDEALAAVEPFRALEAAEMEAVRVGVHQKFDQLCTLCRYCDVCKERIPVYKYMNAYNYQVLGDTPSVKGHLKWHWGIEDVLTALEKCTRCGSCQKECTQRLPIVERLEEIVKLYQAEQSGKK